MLHPPDAQIVTENVCGAAAAGVRRFVPRMARLALTSCCVVLWSVPTCLCSPATDDRSPSAVRSQAVEVHGTRLGGRAVLVVVLGSCPQSPSQWSGSGMSSEPRDAPIPLGVPRLREASPSPLTLDPRVSWRGGGAADNCFRPAWSATRSCVPCSGAARSRSRGGRTDSPFVSRLRYLLAATLALAAVGVGVEHVLLAGAYQPLPPQPQPVSGVPTPLPPPLPVPSSKAGPGLAKAKMNVEAGAAAIEQYAAAHGNSYRGVTFARLRRYDPQLDASVHIVGVTAHSYCIESSIGGAAVSESVPGGFVQSSCGWSA